MITINNFTNRATRHLYSFSSAATLIFLCISVVQICSIIPALSLFRLYQTSRILIYPHTCCEMKIIYQLSNFQWSKKNVVTQWSIVLTWDSSLVYYWVFHGDLCRDSNSPFLHKPSLKLIWNTCHLFVHRCERRPPWSY